MTRVENAGVENAGVDNAHEMTWKCGRLMRQLNSRECVDGRSFMYTLNREGDKTEPWGRPFLWSLQELHLSAMCTRKRLSLRNRATVSTIQRGRVLESFCTVVDPGAKPHRKQLSGLRSKKTTPVFTARC